jgi:hypothetical protein
VNHVVVEGPIIRTKWSHVQITFTEANIELTCFLHMNVMVISANIDKWNVTRVLVDNGSRAEILFLSTFEQMGFNKKQLKEASKPLYGFSGKKIELVGSISLHMSFGTLTNARTEYITFDVVDISYPYNAIFGRGSINTFEVALHSLYLCLKIPATQGVILFHSSQKDARNIEQGFASGHINVNCLQDGKTEDHSSITNRQSEGSFGSRPIELECKIQTIPVDLRVLDKMVTISQDLAPSEEEELHLFLDKNSDVFAWKTSDLMGVSRDIIEHKLEVNPSAWPRKQRLHKMSDKKITAAKGKVQRLLDASFIREVYYPSWLANVVMVKKKNGKSRMCTDFTDLNK